MALYIKYGDVNEIQWHVGSRTDFSGHLMETLHSVSADGDELGAILGKFTNLPCLRMDEETPQFTPRAYMMSWYGDHAKFIAGNLNLLK